MCSDSRCINDKICKRKGLLTFREIIEKIEKDGDELVVSHAKFPLWLKADGYQFSHFMS